MNSTDRPNHDMALLVERARELAARGTRRAAANLLERHRCPLPVIARILSPGPHRASNGKPGAEKNT